MASYLFYLLFIVFPLGQIFSLDFTSYGISIYPIDMVIVALIIFYLFANRQRLMKTLLQSILFKPICLFLLAAFLSLLFSLTRFSMAEVFYASFYLWRWVFYALIYFITLDLIKAGQWQLRKLFNLLLTAGTIFVLIGLIQFFAGITIPFQSVIHQRGYDIHAHRLFSTLFDPNFSGAISLLTFCLATSFWFNKDNQRRWFYFVRNKLVYFLISLTALLATFFTYSRGSILAILIVSLFFLLIQSSHRKRFFILTALSLTVSLVYFLGNRGINTDLFRPVYRDWTVALETIKKYPFFGVGFNTLRYYKRDAGLIAGEGWRYGHSAAGFDASLLFVWATSGILGLLSYLWLGYKIISKAYSILISDPSQKTTATIVVGSLLGISVHSFSINSLFYPWVMVWLWLIFAGIEFI